MKANQAFRQNDEAVSPVIGVILMVAITVVLAAVVFVLVTKLAGNQKEQAPTISFSRVDASSTTGGTLTVVSVQGPAITWGEVCVKGNGANAGPAGSSSLCGTASATCTYSALATATVTAGDIITCTANGPFDIYHQPSNTVFTHVLFHS